LSVLKPEVFPIVLFHESLVHPTTQILFTQKPTLRDIVLVLLEAFEVVLHERFTLPVVV